MTTRDKGSVRAGIFKKTSIPQENGDIDPVEIKEPKTRSGLYLKRDTDMLIEEMRLLLYRREGKRPTRSEVAEQALQAYYALLKGEQGIS